MLKPKKKARPPRDVNQLARYVVDLTTAEKSEEPTKEEVSKVMASLGRRGGKIGGKKRLETLTPERRSEIAYRAAQARWKKTKRRKAG